MALIRFIAQPPPAMQRNIGPWASQQLRDVDRSITAILLLLELLDGVQIEVGPADSAGIGYRALRIPN